jgi:hypothetical protein
MKKTIFFCDKCEKEIQVKDNTNGVLTKMWTSLDGTPFDVNVTVIIKGDLEKDLCRECHKKALDKFFLDIAENLKKP